MGNILTHLKFLADNFNNQSNGFYVNQYESAVEVKPVPLKEVFTDSEIRRIKLNIKPKAKECYRNATLLAQMFNCEYCEGFYTCYGLPLEHAFNKVRGKYVDITAELALKRDGEDVEYAVIGCYNFDEVSRVIVKTGYYGNIFREKFVEKVFDNK